MDELTLLNKLRRIDALHAGATTPGERDAAYRARQRILKRLEQSRSERPVEYRFPMRDRWSRRLFVALLRRHGIAPYRYKRQRRTTVMARATRRFVEETLWPEFLELSVNLEESLSEVTEGMIREILEVEPCEPDLVPSRPNHWQNR